MSLRISGIPNTVAELVALQNYVIECRDVTMYNIKEKMRQTVEYVLFLMDYAHLSGKLNEGSNYFLKRYVFYCLFS